MITFWDVMASKACGALSGLEKPKIGLFDQENTDGRRLIQSPKLYKMVVMLFMFSIVLAETINYSGDCHFQFAEVILLQSWTQIQQIVYHLLRFFAKRELIQKDCPKEDEVLCTYHLKTLMLWTCEEMSPEWWNSSSVIAICCELLKKLSEWLKRRYCPNYFIPEANLFHEPSSSTMLERLKDD